MRTRRLLNMIVVFLAILCANMSMAQNTGVVRVTSEPRNAANPMTEFSDQAVSRKYVLNFTHPSNGGLILERYELGECRKEGNSHLFSGMTRLMGELVVDPQLLQTRLALLFSSGFSAYAYINLPRSKMKMIWCDGRIKNGALNIPLVFIYAAPEGEDSILARLQPQMQDGVIASEDLYAAIESLPQKPRSYYIYCLTLLAD